MDTAFNASLILLTAVQTALLFAYARIFTRGVAEGVGRLARPLLVGSLGVHLLSILLRSALIGACPLGTWSEVVSVVAFSIYVTYFVVEVRIGDRSTGVFATTPAYLLSLVSAVAMLGATDPATTRVDLAQALHVVAAVIGFSAVALCGVYGFLYLFLYTAIKRDQFGLFYRRMPSLETLSDLNHSSTWVAFVALTGSLVLGFWAQGAGETGVLTLVEPAVLVTLVMWALYGACLLAWRFLGLGGKRLAYTTLLGFLMLVGVFFWGLFRHGFHD